MTAASGAARAVTEHPAPPDVVLDRPAHLPDHYMPTTTSSSTCTGDWRGRVASGEIDELRQELRERFGPLPGRGRDGCSTVAAPRRSAAALGLQHILVRGDEARVTFRPGPSRE